jgi:hypothetical protein
VRYGTEGDVRVFQMDTHYGGYGSESADYAQAFRHLVIEKAFAGAVGLNPFSINNKLGDGALPGASDDFVGGPGSRLDVDLGIGNIVLGEKTPGDAAIGTPKSRVEGYLHA